MKELWSFEMSEISHPLMQVHNPAEQIPLPHQCENLKTHKIYHTQSHMIYLVWYQGYVHYYVLKLHILSFYWTKRALRHFPEKFMLWNPNRMSLGFFQTRVSPLGFSLTPKCILSSLYGFLQPFKANVRIIPQIRPQLLSFTSCLIHYPAINHTTWNTDRITE
jgi:hypothetical protein